jgi:uncharacterized membrane protein
MAFTRPLLLLLLVLLPYFAYLGWPVGRYGRGRAWAALVLRCLIGLLVVLSLAGTQSVHGGDELAVVFLVDVSDSVPEVERERAVAFVEGSLAAMRAGDRAAVVLFGADALVERPMMGGGELGEVTSIPHTQQTDLEGAIRLGMALFPSGAARRLVLLSDGRPTLGEAEQAVRSARSQGIQVDVVPLLSPLSTDGQDGAEAWVSDLAMPNRVHQGEEFTLAITARATGDVAAALTVLAGERVVAQERVRLSPGDNTFAIPLVAGEPGFTPFRVYLTPAADVYPQNNALSTFTMVEGPPRVLVVAASEEDEERAYIRAALEAAGLVVEERTPGAMASDPAGLAGYGAVVLVDTPARAFSPRGLAALQSYVRDLGGGLVAVGGPHAYGVGGWYNTPLEETLPVEMTIHDPERFPPMSIVVVIDKSGSMGAEEGGVQKIRLAGEAAARVAELITELDEITVIAFDDRPVDVIGPLPGSRRGEMIEQVVRLQAGGGGIYVRESLQEALAYLADSDRAVRHVILLADGSDAEHQEGVPGLVEEEIAAQNITLSTVAIGAGSDLRFLEQIATLGNGRYHFTDRAANLPVIFAEETQLAMRSYIVEEPFYPRQTALSPILTGIEAVPQLAGYVATTPKPTGRVILATHQDDPLLAAWQYGLGRAVAWTSDGTARWAQRWVSWEGFSRFWAQAVRWTIVEQIGTPVEVAVTLEGEEARIGVDVADESGGFVNGLEAQVSLVGPDGEAVQVDLAQTAPGRYEGVFVPEVEGAYVMRLAASPRGEEEGGVPAGAEGVASTTGWVMGYSPEYAALEGDPAYLARLAELGDGGVLEEPAAAVAHTLRGEGVRRDLWPHLLALAVLLLPFDVGVRRLALNRRDLRRVWDWVAGRLPRRRPRPVAETPSPVARLFQAKSRAEGQRAGPNVAAPGIAPPPSAGGTGSSAPLSGPGFPPPAGDSLAPQRKAGGDATAEGETLAGRLLRKKRERDEG